MLLEIDPLAPDRYKSSPLSSFNTSLVFAISCFSISADTDGSPSSNSLEYLFNNSTFSFCTSGGILIVLGENDVVTNKCNTIPTQSLVSIYLVIVSTSILSFNNALPIFCSNPA